MPGSFLCCFIFIPLKNFIYHLPKTFNRAQSKVNVYTVIDHHKEKIISRIKTDLKYKEGYEKAKEIIFNIEHPIDKISEFIELLNNGYIPKYEDKETKFSNGDIINQFWYKNKNNIKEKIAFDKKYQIGYEKAKEIIKHTEIDKISEYIELMNRGYIPQKKDDKTK